MIYFDKTINMTEAARVASLLDCVLCGDGKGNLIITPVKAHEVQRNNIVSFRQPAPQPKHLPPGSAA